MNRFELKPKPFVTKVNPLIVIDEGTKSKSYNSLCFIVMSTFMAILFSLPATSSGCTALDTQNAHSIYAAH